MNELTEEWAEKAEAISTHDTKWIGMCPDCVVRCIGRVSAIPLPVSIFILHIYVFGIKCKYSYDMFTLPENRQLYKSNSVLKS